MTRFKFGRLWRHKNKWWSYTNTSSPYANILTYERDYHLLKMHFGELASTRDQLIGTTGRRIMVSYVNSLCAAPSSQLRHALAQSTSRASPVGNMSAVQRARKHARCVVRFSDRELWAPEQAACEVQRRAAGRAAMVSGDERCERSVAGWLSTAPLAA